MNDLSSRELAISLLEQYENLLSSAQKEIATDYYRYDLSMSEIAENRGVSKAAVKDALDKALSKLKECEDAIGNLKRRQIILDRLKEISSLEESKRLEEYEKLAKEYRDGI